MCISVLEVPNRSNIKIHPLNFYYNSEGCIGVGEKFKDMNYDNLQDITSSRPTLRKLMKQLPKKFRLRIVQVSSAQFH